MRKATDNQYSNDVRLGAMLNLTFQPRNSNHRYEWKNIFNQIAKDRYSERVGFMPSPIKSITWNTTTPAGDL
jgi:hypothetical protein